MADQLSGVFRDEIPVNIRLTATARTALGTPDADIPLKKLTLRDGQYLAQYDDGAGNVTLYLLPPESVLYARQIQPAQQQPPAPSGG